MKFRHELKYLINEGDAALIRQRLQMVMEPDRHARKGSYHIRSLYFDDYWNTAYNDKINGVDHRQKYRIRLYDLQEDFIRLECKIKSGAYISKRGARLSREETERILKGDYGFLLRREEEACRRFYAACVTRVLRPRVYTDYEREPYVLAAGDVRVTFDRNVRGASPGFWITESAMPFYEALEPGKLIMEVKFTEFLPELVRLLLPARAAELSAVSKYTLCCDQIRHLTAGI